MRKSTNWAEIAHPLNVLDVAACKHHLTHWTHAEATPTGVRFTCETASGAEVEARLDVTLPDVIRLRANPHGVHDGPAELRVDPPPTPAFDVVIGADAVILTTERLRVEVGRRPWQVRVYDRADDALPVFQERVDDRAYGPAYEVPPIGFEPGEDGAYTAWESVVAQPGEFFYGFGERFTALNKWGHEIISWAEDVGNVTSHRSYKNVPFFMSSSGYGVFVNSTYPIIYRMGTESGITYSFYVADAQLDYFILYGPSFKHILRRYADLTGHAPVPPKWSFGFWISRCGYRSRDEVEAVIREMRARDFPCDVISLDPWWMGDPPWSSLQWDTDAFPQPEAMIHGLREQGVKTCLWITPYAPPGTDLHVEGAAHEYFVKRPDGALAQVVEAFAGGDLAAVDFTNPAAAAWYLSWLEKLLNMGVATFKTDFGEQAPVDAVYHDGRSGVEMHNLYPQLYNGAVFGLTARKFGRGLVWGRAAYAGSQRYPVQWGGDSYACLGQMGGQLRGLIGYGLSGVPFCSHDVGGFDCSPRAFDALGDIDMQQHITANNQDMLEAVEGSRSPLVYARWMQFGVFSSHVRAHGKGPHEPWAYGPEVEAIARRYLKLRYRLLPYIYSEAVRAAASGLPLVRAMALEFQDDPTTYALETQYLFGPDFLVAPVLNAAGRVRVYFPAGDWIDFWTGEAITGPRWLDVTAPLETLPLWVRAGAIIPLGPAMDYVDQQPLDPLTLRLFAPGAAGETVIHDEDRPALPVRYRQRDGVLAVEVAAPGAVEIELIGVRAVGAAFNDAPLPITTDADGVVRARIDDAAAGAVVTFTLAGR